jgi:2-polyprenyl-3-methyl-5-hydroxy-6-metoxy-1,4-benzoquinol methylase
LSLLSDLKLMGIQKLGKLDLRVPEWKPLPQEGRNCPFCGEYSEALFLRPDNLPVSKCSLCRCFYVSVRLDNDALNAFYDSYWSVSCPRPLTDEMALYLLASAEKRAASDHTMQKLGALSGTWKDKKVLDVGCGFGEKATMMKELGASVIGLDISADAVKFTKEMLGIESHQTSIESFRGYQHQFDLVTMFEFIEHPLDPLNAIHLSLEKVKTGGLLAIVTPNGTAGDQFLKNQEGWIGFRAELEHMQYLHVDTIAWLAGKFGCRIMHLEQFGFRAFEINSDQKQCRTNLKQRRLRKFIKDIPGVRKAVYAFREFQSKKLVANMPLRDAGVYHLFAVLQKLQQ